jgi:hypothetical protein
VQFRQQSSGELLEIEPRFEIGAGGQARIYTVPNRDSLAKIYRAPKEEYARKLKVMLDNPPVDPTAAQGHVSIAWPIDLLRTTEANGRVAGYLMPRAPGIRHLIDVYNPSSRRSECPLFNYLYLYRTARNLASVVHALHSRDYVIGDVNESNILVTDTALVTVVDTDSFQVRDPESGTAFHCPVGKPEFTPAELQGKMLHYLDRTPEHDRFGMAVLIFLLLMEGTHPFAGVYTGEGDPPPYEERIAAGHFAYGLRPSPYRPQPIAPSVGLLPESIWRLFVRCFEDGHDDPKARPDALTWSRALREAEHSLVTCAVNDQHRYGDHLEECPWCQRAARLGGRDPFPSRESVQSQQHLAPGVPVQTPLPTAATPVSAYPALTAVQPVGASARLAQAGAMEAGSAEIRPEPTSILVESTLPAPPQPAAPPATRITVAARSEAPAPTRRPRRALFFVALAVVGIGVTLALRSHLARPPESAPAAPRSAAERAAQLKTLNAAVMDGNVSRVRALLLQDRSLVHQKKETGYTPLHFAAFYGQVGPAQALIENGADVNAADNDGYTPLHLAAQEGMTAVAQVLLDRGARIDALENKGWTPLHIAAQEGRLEMAKLLVARGADLNIKEKSKGLTPLGVALKVNRSEIADLLRRNGAQP